MSKIVVYSSLKDMTSLTKRILYTHVYKNIIELGDKLSICRAIRIDKNANKKYGSLKE